MKLRRAELVSFLIIIASLVVGVYLYPQLPDKVASHWNTQGEVDGYVSRFWGVALMPLVAFGLWILLLIVPRIDPKKENIEKFRDSFDNFIVLLFTFLAYLYGLTLAWSLGYTFHMIQFLVPAFAVLFYAIGAMLGHAHMNWTIGIRTPWTLSSPQVWKETHRVGSTLFKAAAFFVLLGMVFPNSALWLLLIPVFAIVIFLVVFSYVKYQKITHV